MDHLRQHPLAAALIAGGLSATGFAPLDAWPLLLAGLALWLWLVHLAPSLRAALLRGWLFGVGHFAVGNNWIQHAFDFQDKMPPVLGYVAVILLSLYLAIYPMFVAGLAWRYGRRGDGPDEAFVLIAAAAWIVTEWLRATMFTGYAWNPLGVAWLPVIGVARMASLIGAYALSGVTVLAAGALLLAVQRRWRWAAGVGAVLLLAALSPLVHQRPGVDATRLVRVVQPNIGQDGVSDPGYAEHLFTTELALSGQAGAKPRLLVWPEGMVPYYLESGYPEPWYFQANPVVTRARIAQRMGVKDVAVLGGNALIFRPGEDRLAGAANSVFVMTADGMLGPKRYDKAHLVPYGEYLPARWLLQPMGLARLVMGEVDFVPGPGPQTLDVPGFGRMGVQICYEIIFSGEVVDQAHRPDLLLHPSNDAWFGTWGPPEHLAQARLRAIEEGLPVIRATPTGISAVIAADGQMLGTIPAGRAAALELPLPRPLPPTLFSRLGNLAAFLIAALMIAAAVAFRRVKR